MLMEKASQAFVEKTLQTDYPLINQTNTKDTNFAANNIEAQKK